MQIDLTPDFPLTDEACKAETGQTLSHWIAAIDSKPELAGKRRDVITGWLYPEMGKNIWWATTAWVECERKNGVLQKDGRIEGYNICVTKKIAAPLEKVYAAWVSGDIAKWYGDDPKLLDDKSIADSAGNTASALRVRENKDLRYAWKSNTGGDGTQVEVAFTNDPGGKTLITLMHNRIQTRAESDGLRRAWGDAFNRLKSILE